MTDKLNEITGRGHLCLSYQLWRIPEGGDGGVLEVSGLVIYMIF